MSGYVDRRELAIDDSVTLLGFTKFVLFVAALLGAMYLSEAFGVDRWFKAAIQALGALVGLKAAWAGYKSLKYGEPLPEDSAPRYAQIDIFFSSRAAAQSAVLVGLLVAAAAAYQAFVILSE